VQQLRTVWLAWLGPEEYSFGSFGLKDCLARAGWQEDMSPLGIGRQENGYVRKYRQLLLAQNRFGRTVFGGAFYHVLHIARHIAGNRRFRD
jgi:hypothetical protein